MLWMVVVGGNAERDLTVGASSELVRSWFEAEIWPTIELASSELARASRFAAKFHYTSWFGAGSEPFRSWFGACSEPAPN